MTTHFLLVDDLEENCRLMRRLISRHFPDGVIAEARSGTEALQRVAEAKPDIMVLDVLMPDIDGFEVCRRIKDEPQTQSVLVMLVSAHMTDTRSRISGLQCGADNYLCKPFANDEFIAQLGALQRILQTEKALQQEQQRLTEELELRKRLGKELEAAKTAAETAARAKSDFLALMSHEIRTPMNAVIGMTEILLDTELSAEQQEYVKTINTAGETLLMVINDILDHSKIESGKLSLEARPFRLDALLDDAIGMVRKQADAKGLRLAVSIAPDTPREVIGDTIRLRQIVSNLLSNAIKFTESGSVRVAVSACRLGREQCDLYLQVEDSGIGIPADKLERLFKPFSQVDDSTTRRFGGTGLGLTICKRLAELMGGDIRVESREGEGTVFHVRVRLRCARTANGSSDAGAADALQKLSVLIVDADAGDRERLVRQVESWRMPVVAASSLEEALERMRGAARPDVLLLGGGAGTDRLAWARQVREVDELGALPLVYLTEGDPVQADWDPAGRSPFAACLQKPVEPSALFDVLVGLRHRKGEGVAEVVDGAPDVGALRVLVAEDNAVNRKVVEFMLRQLGCATDFAEDGRAAVAAVREQAYDLILMDVQMPHMDGVEALHAIRGEGAPDDRAPYVVALTAHAMQGDREKYLAEGMDDYVSKPVRMKELKRVLAACAARRQNQEPPL